MFNSERCDKCEQSYPANICPVNMALATERYHSNHLCPNCRSYVSATHYDIAIKHAGHKRPCNRCPLQAKCLTLQLETPRPGPIEIWVDEIKLKPDEDYTIVGSTLSVCNPSKIPMYLSIRYEDSWRDTCSFMVHPQSTTCIEF